MPRWIVPLFILLLILVFVEYYTYQALKTVLKNKTLATLVTSVSLVVYLGYFYLIITGSRQRMQSLNFQYANALLLVVLLPKIIIGFVLLGEDFFTAVKRIFLTKEQVVGRRKFVSQLALGLASIPFLSLLYGVFKGRYNFKVIKYELSFDDLPENFDGYTITHITDIHSGSFDNSEKIQYAIDLINKQQSDVILFTGDIVNNYASEMDQWITQFKSLKAKDGKFSVLGNHDYGDYVSWESKEAKNDNFEAVKNIHSKIGFKLLLNESEYLTKGDQKVALVGIENWGKDFKKVGDLDKASQKINKSDFKVLMSHDPSHWDLKVKEDVFNYQLTLSGHTHGFQFGIEIPGFIKWSPAKYRYKQWAGLYKEHNRFINVNRGFGYHAFPGRIGVWPEITVIKLKKSSSINV